MASLSVGLAHASNPAGSAPVAKETLDQGDGIQPLAMGPIDLGLTAVCCEGRSLMLVVERPMISLADSDQDPASPRRTHVLSGEDRDPAGRS
jgi:hypothetical protein